MNDEKQKKKFISFKTYIRVASLFQKLLINFKTLACAPLIRESLVQKRGRDIPLVENIILCARLFRNKKVKGNKAIKKQRIKHQT